MPPDTRVAASRATEQPSNRATEQPSNRATNRERGWRPREGVGGALVRVVRAFSVCKIGIEDGQKRQRP